MTVHRTCLRCDWQGETDGSKCPDCAAPCTSSGRQPPEGAGAEVRSHPEERSREAASTAIVAPSAAPPRPSSPPPPSSTEQTQAAEPTTTRSRSLVAIVVSFVVLAVAVGAWLNAHEAPTEAAAPRTPEIADPASAAHRHARVRRPGRSGSLPALAVRPRDADGDPRPTCPARDRADRCALRRPQVAGPHVRAPQRARAGVRPALPSPPTPGRRRCWRATS